MTNVYLWLGAVILFGVVEALTVGIVSIWFSIGALAALIAAALHAAPWLQITVFLAVSAAALISIDFSTSAEETINCDYSGTPMAIGFKAPFLIDLLSSIASDDVQLKLADPARAGLILPAENEENEDVLMLLMPMLLND